ncbi:hypothetical protein PTKIN_Ptkin14bG0008900 [Pterospermum kingtungense]
MPTQHVRLQSLESVSLYQCGKLKSVFSFSLAQCLIRLQLLEIEYCDELKQIMEEFEGSEQEISANRNPKKSLCLPKLETLKICHCDRLEYIFPNFMASQGLPQLQKLCMEGLPQLKQICRPAMQREENSILQSQLQELLPSLTKLTLRDCPELTDAMVIPKKAKLKGIQLSKLRDAMFTNTKYLFLVRINGDHNFIPEFDREGLNGLTTLEFNNCSSFEYLIDATKENVPNSAFTNLAKLSLTNIDGLKMLCKGQSPKGFLQNLKKLKVKRCNELREFFRIDVRWEDNRTQTLSNLKKLTVKRCNELKSLFSQSLIQSLRQLEQLRIQDCAKLKTLFAESESVGETESNSHLRPLCLPRLTTLLISKCEKLEYVLPITLAQCLPQLECARVGECPQLKKVFGGVAKEHDGVEHCIKLPHLRDLQLYQLTNFGSFGPENYLVEVPALKELSVSATPQLMKFTTRQSVHCKKNLIPDVDVNPEGLTSLWLEDCDGLECLTDTTKELAPTSGMFTNLVVLVMLNMIGLKMLYNGQPPKGFLQNLKVLEVEDCMDIVSLYPVGQNLKKLVVKDCSKLQEVFQIDKLSREENRAQLLSDLGSLELRRMPELRWILKGPTQYVSLHNLRDVAIEKCNKLESLFSFSLIPSLRLLEKLWIIDCDNLETVFKELESDCETEPNMLLASAQSLPRLRELYLVGLKNLSSFGPKYYFITAPALKKLKVTDCPCLMNFSIQQDKPLQSKLPDEYNSKLSIETIELHCLVLLRDIWKCPIQVVVLTNLRKLEVHDCNSLTYIFPMILFQNLPQLWSLKIKWCEKVELISGDNDMLASSSQGHDQLDETMAVKNEKQIVMFSKLKHLQLESLTSLVSFSPVGYHLIFPSLCTLEIRNCPRMITSFSVDSISSVHAQTKAVKALDDASPSVPDIIWTYGKRTSLPPYAEESDET